MKLEKKIKKNDKELPFEFEKFKTPEEWFKSYNSNRILNRELSWLEFNSRVLEEARDINNPLAERLNFLSIISSNLDEFFMVRVSSVKDLINANYNYPDPSGLTPKIQLEAISEKTHLMNKKTYDCYGRSVIPLIEKAGLNILSYSELTKTQMQFARNYFLTEVFPALTPLAVDAGRPFPLLDNKSLNLFVAFDQEQNQPNDIGLVPTYAIIQIPTILPRIVDLPEGRIKQSKEELLGVDRPQYFILLEEIIRNNLEVVFEGTKLGKSFCFRITRDTDLDIDEDETADLLTEIENQLRILQRGQVIRLEIEQKYHKNDLKELLKELPVDEQFIYTIKGPLDLTFLTKLAKKLKAPKYHYPTYKPVANPDISADENIFSAIAKKDILLHHPYEQFDPIVRLMRAAARDKSVLAIKQTLYRVSGNSPIIESLAEAAENGKQVTVLVELKARFDEKQNIYWAKKLEKAGCHVIYGLVGLKTHSKITLIVRRENNYIRRYVHLGTGNYNDTTARVYTDMGMLTCAEKFGEDACDFFNMITGYSAPIKFHKLIPAPRWLRSDTLQKIEREARHAREGRKAHIIAKINSLLDAQIIEALYKASGDGVKIDLIVRGICCLRPGVPGMSENISVRSLIGRYLEHSRIFYYFNDNSEDVFLSSADWMPRNMNRRIELLFPVEAEDLKKHLIAILHIQLDDTERARIMQSDGSFKRVDRRGKETLDSQEAFCQMVSERSLKEKQLEIAGEYVPVEAAPEI